MSPPVGTARRLRGVVVDASALVDRHGAPFRDLEPSLLAAREAGLSVVLVVDPDGPPVAPALEQVRVRPPLVSGRAAAGLRGALREAGLSPHDTLHVAAAPDVLAAGNALGMRTAWVNRAGTGAEGTPADEEWRDLLELVALCGATPPVVRSQARC